MSPNNVCPSCGAALEDNAGSSCPFCGSALSLSRSAPTIISAPAKKKKAAANSSAEAMDEIKKLVREGDNAGAAEVASAEFGLNQEDAKGTVLQVGFDMKNADRKPVIVEPAPKSRPSEPVIESRPFDEPQKPSNSRPWIIGGSIAAVVFLCVCCCLPLVIGLISLANNR
jgi:uncharacterized Zn finger protein (UPF0148 family)